VVSNFFGGLMLLFTEPFTPGDLIAFTTRGTFYEGKVSYRRF
jgi:small-conductance mechanosensitive channel